MTLRERQGDIETSHPDKEELNVTQWAKMLEISGSTLRGAAYRGGVRAERTRSVLIPIGDFPKIIEGLTSVKQRRDKWQYPRGIDTSHDFQVTTRSGAVLIYEYPPLVEKATTANAIGKFLRNIFVVGQRRP